MPAEVMSQPSAGRGLWALLSGPQGPKDAVVLSSCLPLAVSVLDPVFLAQRRVSLARQRVKEGEQAKAKEGERAKAKEAGQAR